MTTPADWQRFTRLIVESCNAITRAQDDPLSARVAQVAEDCGRLYGQPLPTMQPDSDGMKKDYCSNRGEVHIGRWHPRMGRQKCHCGRTITVKQIRKEWAFIPLHERPKRAPEEPIW